MSFSWSYLEVETNGTQPDELQAYAAGFAEGRSTADLIYWHWINTVSGYCNGSSAYCKRLAAFLQKNVQWMKTQISLNQYDPYWHQVRWFPFPL